MERKLAELNEYVRRAQRVLAEYLPPDSGKSAEATLGELLGILDSRELVSLQAEITKRPALFANDH